MLESDRNIKNDFIDHTNVVAAVVAAYLIVDDVLETDEEEVWMKLIARSGVILSGPDDGVPRYVYGIGMNIKCRNFSFQVPWS